MEVISHNGIKRCIRLTYLTSTTHFVTCALYCVYKKCLRQTPPYEVEVSKICLLWYRINDILLLHANYKLVYVHRKYRKMSPHRSTTYLAKYILLKTKSIRHSLFKTRIFRCIRSDTHFLSLMFFFLCILNPK